MNQVDWLVTATVYSVLLLLLRTPVLLRKLLAAFPHPLIRQLTDLWSSIWNLNGLANQPTLTAILIPSGFSIFALLAIALMLHDKLRLGAILLGLTGAMHASYIPHTAVISGIAAVGLVRSGQHRRAVEVVSLFTLITLPFVLYTVTFLFAPQQATASATLAQVRFPHHALPAAWFSPEDAFKLALMSTAGILYWSRAPRLISRLCLFTAGYIVVGIIAVWGLHSDALALTFPWRASTILFPFSLILMTASALHVVVRSGFHWHTRTWDLVPRLLVAFGVTIAVGVSTVILVHDGTPTPQQRFYAEVRRATTSRDVIMIPEEWENFRLAAQRPVYVDFKSHPYAADEVVEWWRRIQVSRTFYAGDRTVRAQICVREGLSYYVIEDRKLRGPEDIAVSVKPYHLVSCPTF